MRIGILTSGGDCSGLNPTIRGFCKYINTNAKDVELLGFIDGYVGLINCDYRILTESDYEGILDMGGTILGTIRQPYKLMTVSAEGEPTKLDMMVANYRKLNLDCLVTLGGAGTHKTATLLSVAGCNVIGLPKTIDNDIYGTDVTFGFHTAVDIATECIKRIHTTAKSHSRTIFVEVMGNKVGWLTLYAGVAGGADIILLPEMPYDEDKLCQYIVDRYNSGKRSAVVAVAEGASSTYEASLGKKERRLHNEQLQEHSIAQRLANLVAERTGTATRASVLGHIQRGGDPVAYDKLLSSQIGAYGAQLLLQGTYGVSVTFVDNKVSYNALQDIAGRAKVVPLDNQLIELAQGMGIYFGQ